MIAEVIAVSSTLATIGFGVEALRTHVKLSRAERELATAKEAQGTAERAKVAAELRENVAKARVAQLELELQRTRIEKKGLYDRLAEAGVAGAGDALDDDLRGLYQDTDR